MARQRLRDSERLDYLESARLAAARARAVALLQPTAPRLPVWSWLATPALLAALSFVVLNPSLHRLQTPSAASEASAELVASIGAVNASSPSALEWGTDEAGLDFYRDLEFYEWLQSRSPPEPNA
jgi:hypothetical protein